MAKARVDYQTYTGRKGQSTKDCKVPGRTGTSKTKGDDDTSRLSIKNIL